MTNATLHDFNQTVDSLPASTAAAVSFPVAPDVTSSLKHSKEVSRVCDTMPVFRLPVTVVTVDSWTVTIVCEPVVSLHSKNSSSPSALLGLGVWLGVEVGGVGGCGIMSGGNTLKE